MRLFAVTLVLLRLLCVPSQVFASDSLVNSDPSRASQPVRFYLSYEDSGNSYIGRDLWGIGVTWSELFGRDQSLAYGYQRSGRRGGVEVHGLNFRGELWRGHGVSLDLRYSQVSDDLLAEPSLRGEVLSVRYLPPLGAGDKSTQQSVQQLKLGVDYKTYNNDLEYFGYSVYDDAVTLMQLVMDYSAVVSDPYGENLLAFTLVHSPGELLDGNSNDKFSAARAGTDSRYQYLVLGYERRQLLPHDYIWVLRTSMQRTSGRLLPSEQFGLGGRTSVRGFSEREVNGDQGYGVSNELRSPGFKTGFGRQRLASELQLLVFSDMGRSRLLEPQVGEVRWQLLSSVGFGLRYQLGDFVEIQGDFGWQVDGRKDTFGDDSRTHLQVLLRY